MVPPGSDCVCLPMTNRSPEKQRLNRNGGIRKCRLLSSLHAALVIGDIHVVAKRVEALKFFGADDFKSSRDIALDH